MAKLAVAIEDYGSAIPEAATPGVPYAYEIRPDTKLPNHHACDGVDLWASTAKFR